MQLIPKRDMIAKEWITFEHYPKQGANIVLHIRGYRIRENKYCHDFISLSNFDALHFDKRDYTPSIKFVTWDYSWLPTTSLMEQ